MNSQDYATANWDFVMSMVNVSSTEYQRALDYMNEYNDAKLQLSQVFTNLMTSLQNVSNMTNVETLTSIGKNLTSSVAKLAGEYSPDNVRSYILYYYQTFLTSLSLNNGTQTDVLEMNLLYFSNVLNPNASSCLMKYNSENTKIYSSAALNFTEKMENEIALTVEQLETLRTEIKTTVASLITSLSGISDNREAEFDDFVSFS